MIDLKNETLKVSLANLHPGEQESLASNRHNQPKRPLGSIARHETFSGYINDNHLRI